jgi:hypothetical protein
MTDGEGVPVDLGSRVTHKLQPEKAPQRWLQRLTRKICKIYIRLHGSQVAGFNRRISYPKGREPNSSATTSYPSPLQEDRTKLETRSLSAAIIKKF